jgi:hypothetical protein
MDLSLTLLLFLCTLSECNAHCSDAGGSDGKLGVNHHNARTHLVGTSRVNGELLEIAMVVNISKSGPTVAMLHVLCIGFPTVIFILHIRRMTILVIFLLASPTNKYTRRT